jgi:hypothetical protein
MTDQPIQVTVHDPVTGETVTRELMNDYLILAAGTCTYQIDADLVTGVHVITVTGRRGKANAGPEPLIDPDCRGGKCSSCVGGPCEHHCHKEPTHA